MSLHLRGHRWSFACDAAGLPEMIERVGAMGRDPTCPLGRFGASLVREQLLRGEALPHGLHRPEGESGAQQGA